MKITQLQLFELAEVHAGKKTLRHDRLRRIFENFRAFQEKMENSISFEAETKLASFFSVGRYDGRHMCFFANCKFNNSRSSFKRSTFTCVRTRSFKLKKYGRLIERGRRKTISPTQLTMHRQANKESSHSSWYDAVSISFLQQLQLDISTTRSG